MSPCTTPRSADAPPTFALTRSDAFGWLNSLPPESVDLIVTDPPYESLEKHRAVGAVPRLQKWFGIVPNERLGDLMVALYRVLKNNSHAYVFCDQVTAFLLKPMGEAAGFKFWKPVIWDKVHIGMGYHYRSRYEMILFFEKGKRRLSNWGIPDILQAKRIRNGYPTEKPVALAETLISQSSSPGQLVCDPFCGSSAFGVAAINSGRHFIGCDIGQEALSLSRARLQEAHGRHST